MVYILYLVGHHVLWWSMMRAYIILTLWIMFCLGMAFATFQTTGCVGDGKRVTWQDCAGVSHEICRMMPDSGLELDCEYEYYKKCINE